MTTEELRAIIERAFQAEGVSFHSFLSTRTTNTDEAIGRAVARIFAGIEAEQRRPHPGRGGLAEQRTTFL